MIVVAVQNWTLNSDNLTRKLFPGNTLKLESVTKKSTKTLIIAGSWKADYNKFVKITYYLLWPKHRDPPDR